MSRPEIRINFSGLLYEDISRQIFTLHQWDLPSVEQCEAWVEDYRQAWGKKEEIILTAMQDITGLEFYLETIDITAAPGVIPKSEPLLINFIHKPEVTIHTVTHELTHTLLCDNKVVSVYGKDRDFQLASEWHRLFGFDNDRRALVHVPVHAINQIIFEQYLNESSFVSDQRELLEKRNATSYLKSWDYVEKEGADKIVSKLKQSYTDIAKKLENKK